MSERMRGAPPAGDDGRSGEAPILARILPAIGLAESRAGPLRFEGTALLPSAFPVAALAAAAIGTAALAVAELAATATAPAIRVSRPLSALWFARSLLPIGWTLPPAWDPVAGDYASRDGWIRLHTNAPRHRAAALSVLGCGADRPSVAAAASRWEAAALEEAVVAAGGCAAAMRSAAEWARHPQGCAVAAEPLVAFAPAETSPSAWRPSPGRPLAGLRILDLTRILAGPVATRFLAGFGADVLRIDPPDWEEDAVAPEVTLGKSCARLDLRAPRDRETFERLLAGADVLVHGYRPGALDALGYGEAARRSLRPGLIDVSLDAYGWSGPWRARRGFDSLVQMSSGIAEAGMRWRGAGVPVPLPVQALDHATGYLAAAAVLRALRHRLTDGRGLSARLSLARTAALLAAVQGEAAPPGSEGATQTDVATDFAEAAVEATGWGPARRASPPVSIAGTPVRWDRPARPLGSRPASWAESPPA
ncbi:L-carnitine dehydratase/bile acid-inducible protein F [Methylobacterium sp. 4-46]|uniref:CoA transferase n=1 Tax=unclassified Methylobacterium TaxID=2615210 RepID=UPI000152C0A5|nr:MULTISPECIES: CoA transferase [Methylobacterium]ACA18320.1 L-carnitine dehydratase/bile acid-inducible protein F [Methylobacterium sp. 4-46]WFT77619.1 CoA transferase [Methylobacterium nodulans]